VRRLALLLLALPLGAQSPAFENERVRVLTPRYAPGEGRAMHEHPARVMVALTPVHIRQTLKDGSVSEPKLAAGAVRFAAPVHHALVNLGSGPLELVEVELLPRSRGKGAALVSHPAQDPAHLTVELDNEQVRVLRLRLGPHESSALLRQGERVTVALGDAHLRFDGPDGRSQERRLARGSAAFEAAAAHTVVNLGDQPVELVSIEPRN
jgi:hypothetical protein